MKYSADRILTTHVGSLPRPDILADMLSNREAGKSVDEASFNAEVRQAVQDIVSRQVALGVDIVSDGEMAKIGYSTYIKDRCTGFTGDSPRRPPADLARSSRSDGHALYHTRRQRPPSSMHRSNALIEVEGIRVVFNGRVAVDGIRSGTFKTTRLRPPNAARPRTGRLEPGRDTTDSASWMR